jgi:hypothetical protein
MATNLREAGDLRVEVSETREFEAPLAKRHVGCLETCRP